MLPDPPRRARLTQPQRSLLGSLLFCSVSTVGLAVVTVTSRPSWAAWQVMISGLLCGAAWVYLALRWALRKSFSAPEEHFPVFRWFSYGALGIALLMLISRTAPGVIGYAFLLLGGAVPVGVMEQLANDRTASR